MHLIEMIKLFDGCDESTCVVDDTVGVKESLKMLCGDVLPEDCADGSLEVNDPTKVCEMLPEDCADDPEVNKPISEILPEDCADSPEVNETNKDLWMLLLLFFTTNYQIRIAILALF